MLQWKPRLMFVLLVLVLIASLAGGWFHFDLGPMDPDRMLSW